MSEKDRKPFASKHGHKPPGQIDAAIREALERDSEKGELPCAVAFRLADELQKPPAALGEAADLLGRSYRTCNQRGSDDDITKDATNRIIEICQENLNNPPAATTMPGTLTELSTPPAETVTPTPTP